MLSHDYPYNVAKTMPSAPSPSHHHKYIGAINLPFPVDWVVNVLPCFTHIKQGIMVFGHNLLVAFSLILFINQWGHWWWASDGERNKATTYDISNMSFLYQAKQVEIGIPWGTSNMTRQHNGCFSARPHPLTSFGGCPSAHSSVAQKVLVAR